VGGNAMSAVLAYKGSEAGGKAWEAWQAMESFEGNTRAFREMAEPEIKARRERITQIRAGGESSTGANIEPQVSPEEYERVMRQSPAGIGEQIVEDIDLPVIEPPATEEFPAETPAEEQIFGGAVTSAECIITKPGVEFPNEYGGTTRRNSDYQFTARGTATSSLLSGGEGAGLMVAVVNGGHMPLSCGSWTQTSDTSCSRNEGQPETTEWIATLAQEEAGYWSGRSNYIRMDIINGEKAYPVSCPVGPEGPSAG